MRALVLRAFREPPRSRTSPSPSCRPTARSSRSARPAVPQRLARLDRPRRLDPPPPRARPRVRRRRRGGRRRRCAGSGPATASPRRSAAAAGRASRAARATPSLRARLPAGLHRLGLVRRARLVPVADLNCVALPDGARVRGRGGARLPLHDRRSRRSASAARVRAGDWLAVHGCGGVGLSAVMLGRALGARVVAVDVAPGPLARAAELGAEQTVDGSAEDAAAAIRELTGGGAHVSIDAIGSAATAAASVRSLRRRGRHVQVGLLAGDERGARRPDGRADLARARDRRRARDAGARLPGAAAARRLGRGRPGAADRPPDRARGGRCGPRGHGPAGRGHHGDRRATIRSAGSAGPRRWTRCRRGP